MLIREATGDEGPKQGFRPEGWRLRYDIAVHDECREAVHLRGQTVEPPKAAGGGRPKDFTKKAVLLSGPPGIGKTSSALIIARSPASFLLTGAA